MQIALPLAALILLSNSSQGSDRSLEPSPSDLVRSLAVEPGSRSRGVVWVNCGVTDEDRSAREASRRLVDLGAVAVSAIEGALASLERDGTRSEYAVNEWLLVEAYARILGPAAFERLRRLTNSPKLRPMGLGHDWSAAIALGLTSYVSSDRMPGIPHFCHRFSQPRDALDQLILSVETRDRTQLEVALGPKARGALRSVARSLVHRWFSESGRHGWRRKLAMGYRFEMPGPWSAPDGILYPPKPDTPESRALRH